MGLRPKPEKPPTVLPFVYALAWLPAIWMALHAGGRLGAPAVISAAGSNGALAGSGLAATLALLWTAYLAAIRRPPAAGMLAWSAAAGVCAALLVPLLFSADVFAYAAYGALALQAHNPWGAPAMLSGPLAGAAAAAWDGSPPPPCVYGPVAVAVAALADLAGGAAGPVGQIAAQRLAAAGAYAAYVAAFLRLVHDPRARVVGILNPTVIWSVAEGHNDALLAAAAVLGLSRQRARPLLLAAAALVKVVGVAAWSRLRGRGLALAAALTAAGYAPLAGALMSAGTGGHRRFEPAAWQSPLGLLAAATGLPAALALALGAFAAVVFAVRRRPGPERTAALALAGWFGLPNAYPWYALWIVPIAARNISSPWSRALLAAAAFAPARAVLDAVFPAAGHQSSADVFHVPLILLEYVPPLALAVLAVSRRRRRAAPAVAGLLLALALTAGAVPALAQSAPASPVPNPTPVPMPAAPESPSAAESGGAPSPGPAATAPIAPAPTAAPPAPAPPTATPPSAAPLAPPTPAPPPTPSPSLTPNPFGFVLTPRPVPATSPDGPHILEVDVNDRHIHAGGPLMVRVLTSANVVGVEARTLGRFIPIPQNSPGLFAAVYTMPDGIPFWLLNRSYDVVIAAATADGRQTSVSFQMTLTR